MYAHAGRKSGETFGSRSESQRGEVMSASRALRRAWACGSAVLLVLALLIVAPAASAHGGHHGKGLRDLAKRPFIGTAVDMAALADDAAYRNAIRREFNSVTAE